MHDVGLKRVDHRLGRLIIVGLMIMSQGDVCS